MPAGFTEIVRLPGVEPLFGVTVSQDVLVVAVKEAAAPELLIATVCAAGVAPPMG